MEKSRQLPSTHAVRGVVKLVNFFYLAIVAGSGKHAHEMNFNLGPSTERLGNVTIGGTVSIRYRIVNATRMATAVVAQVNGQSAAQSSRI
jgi:hypothetical protein